VLSRADANNDKEAHPLLRTRRSCWPHLNPAETFSPSRNYLLGPLKPARLTKDLSHRSACAASACACATRFRPCTPAAHRHMQSCARAALYRQFGLAGVRAWRKISTHNCWPHSRHPHAAHHQKPAGSADSLAACPRRTLGSEDDADATLRATRRNEAGIYWSAILAISEASGASLPAHSLREPAAYNRLAHRTRQWALLEVSKPHARGVRCHRHFGMRLRGWACRRGVKVKRRAPSSARPGTTSALGHVVQLNVARKRITYYLQYFRIRMQPLA
jgi:hypothetical protein